MADVSALERALYETLHDDRDVDLALEIFGTYLVGKAIVERVARAIAKAMGDDLDIIPADKPEWIATRGHGRGEHFRDVNQPFRCDYTDAAEAALAAILEE